MHAIKTPPHYVADFNDARAAPALKELTSIELKWQYKSGAALSLGIFYKQKASFIHRRGTFTASALAGDSTTKLHFLLFSFPRSAPAPYRRLWLPTHPRFQLNPYLALHLMLST